MIAAAPSSRSIPDRRRRARCVVVKFRAGVEHPAACWLQLIQFATVGKCNFLLDLGLTRWRMSRTDNVNHRPAALLLPRIGLLFFLFRIRLKYVQRENAAQCRQEIEPIQRGRAGAMKRDAKRHVALQRRLKIPVAMLLAAATLSFTSTSQADEGGISFWLPGQFASLAATPATPGWTFAALYYHASVGASGGRNFNRGGNIVVGIEGRGDLVGFAPTYVFHTPVLGAQAAISVFGIAGRNHASVEATLTGPLGNTISGERGQSIWGFGDVYPQASLKWNFGVHNLMTYVMGNVPIGAYDPNRLANLGIGHASIDWGGATHT
jgi:hypothetical protein